MTPISVCFLAVPTRAPENVTYSFSDAILEVSWLPLPVYFHGFYLQGYRVAAFKHNVLIKVWDKKVESRRATIKGLKSEVIDCVAVYAYTRYGNGFSSGCFTEEQGTTETSDNKTNNTILI